MSAAPSRTTSLMTRRRGGGRTALFPRGAFRPPLLLGRQTRPSLYDIRKTRPLPLVAREDCHTVRGRLDPAGREITPLDEAGLRETARRLKRDGVQAVAVCLL